MNKNKIRDDYKPDYPEKISDEELINTLLKVIESQNNIIRRMIRSTTQQPELEKEANDRR